MAVNTQDLLVHLYDPVSKSLRVVLNVPVVFSIGFSLATSFEVDVMSNSTIIAVSNSDRKYLIVTNVSNKIIYLSLNDTAEMSKGIPILPYGNYEITAINLYIGTISAISEEDGKRVLCVEGR